MVCVNSALQVEGGQEWATGKCFKVGTESGKWLSCANTPFSMKTDSGCHYNTCSCVHVIITCSCV